MSPKTIPRAAMVRARDAVAEPAFSVLPVFKFRFLRSQVFGLATWQGIRIDSIEVLYPSLAMIVQKG